MFSRKRIEQKVDTNVFTIRMSMYTRLYHQNVYVYLSLARRVVGSFYSFKVPTCSSSSFRTASAAAAVEVIEAAQFA